ncbi:syntaxin-8-like isoform X1 [Pomacea canaliculata]|uniref:syntaxin-8-like isoform X1 n=1 Tax=Pomacea canaliculata TaxID=400727 RepID=UPI000D735315|nr:syntaxin-8-like isoform X1 [Pomacea canaliculata]
MASDSWLSEYESCSLMGQKIMETINERNKHSRTSSNYTKLSANVRTSLRQFSNDLNRLKQNLIRASSSYHITQREVERRQQMLDSLLTKEKHIDQAFKNDSGDSRYIQPSSRRALLNPQSEDFGSTSDPWGQGDPLENVSNTELQSQQQQILDEQDRGLDALSRVIGRQKQMAIDIGNEVDSQNEIIDDITDHVDGTTSRLKRETRHIAIVDRKSGSCGYYIVIVLLFVVIIVIVAVPYNGKP